MNLNRLKKNIINRDWSSKTKQSNINYIKGKLKQYGLSVPKYLNQGKLTDRQIAIIILANTCGKVLAYCSLYPKDIFKIAYNYLFGGCKSRGDYEYLVNFLIENPTFRKELFI